MSSDDIMRSPDGAQKKLRPRRPDEGDEQRQRRPRRPVVGDGDEGGEPRKRRPRRPVGDGDDHDEHRKRRPRRPPGDDEDADGERRKHRPRRPTGDGNDDEHRKHRPRRPVGEGDEGGRARSRLRKPSSRSGEERRSESAQRRIRKPRPPEDMTEEEFMKRKMRARRKKEMEDSQGTLGSMEGLDEDELLQRKMRKKKSRELDDSAGTLGSTEDFEGEMRSPRRVKPNRVKNMPDMESGDLETPRTRKKKLRPPDESSKSSKGAEGRNKLVSPTASNNSLKEEPMQNSAAAFDVESFIKRQQTKKEGNSPRPEDQDGGVPAGFDVGDFIKRQQAIKTSTTNTQSATPPPDLEQQRAEDAKKVAFLEGQIDSLNKQMEQQELELAQSLGEVAAHEETKRELEQLRQQLDGVREDDYERAAHGSASIEMLTEQLEQQRQDLERAMKKAAAGEEAQRELLEIQAQFNIVIDEKGDLITALDSAEKEMETKDRRVLTLEKAVESQLDAIDGLEEKLEGTEDELFRMEDELKDLESKGNLDESAHSKERVTRIDNIRLDRMQRPNEIRMEKSLSQRLLSSSSHNALKSKSAEQSEDEKLMKDIDSMEDEMKRMGDEFNALNSGAGNAYSTETPDSAKRKAELEQWDKELAERERHLEAEREQNELRTLRLEEWEKELLDKKTEPKESPHLGESEELDEMRRELEEREDVLRDIQEALEREKAEIEMAKLGSDKEQRRNSGAGNAYSTETPDSAKRKAELEQWDKELAERERHLEAEREQNELRTLRLEEWEKELLDKKTEPKESPHLGESEELDEMRRELEEREDILRDIQEALEREKAEIEMAKLGSDKEQRSVDENTNGHGNMSMDVREEVEEMEKEISHLTEACQQLEQEKVDTIRTREEDDVQRDEELGRIQQDIHEKLMALNQDNLDLRTQLEEATQKALKVSGLQKVINLLEDEVRSLRRGTDQDEALSQHREGVARQLAELDEENQTLAEELTKHKKDFEEAIEEKQATISELEAMLHESQKKLQSASSGGGAFTASLLKEVSDLKQKLRAAENGEEGAGQLANKLQEKDALLAELNESMMKLKLELDDQQAAGSPADARVVELEGQIEALKADFALRASKDTLTKLRNEVKTLKETVRDLRKELKTEKQESESKLKKKEEAIGFFQAQMMTMTQDLARYQKREQRKPGFFNSMGGASAELQQKVEDLEDEVDRWKTSNMQLEDQVAVLKADRIELRNKLDARPKEEGKFNDDIHEEGSLEGSFNADDTMGSSISTMAQKESNVMSNSSGTGHASTSSSALEAGTERAMKTFGGLWNAVKSAQPPAAPRGLYSMGQDD
jgi:hypothetical protein